MAVYHIEYITRRIENEELLTKIKNYEEIYNVTKKPYPIANKNDLSRLEKFMETEKQGFIAARITTMFELLRNFFRHFFMLKVILEKYQYFSNKLGRLIDFF